MTLVDFKLAAFVDKWIGMALEQDAKEIDIQVQSKRNTWYCLLGTIFVAQSTNNCKLEQPFSWSALNYYSLQKLWLSHICVNEEIIQDIFRSCPFINDFGLVGCHGLKTLDISKLPKLCSVDVRPLKQKVEIVRVEAVNLEFFRFCYSGECLLDITACQNLTRFVKSAKKCCMPQATQLASGAAGTNEGCTSSATRAAVSAAVANARCIGQATRAASNAAFADELCTDQTTKLASKDMINSVVLELLESMPHHEFFIQESRS